jgi:hypothetical protein
MEVCKQPPHLAGVREGSTCDVCFGSRHAIWGTAVVCKLGLALPVHVCLSAACLKRVSHARNMYQRGMICCAALCVPQVITLASITGSTATSSLRDDSPPPVSTPTTTAFSVNGSSSSSSSSSSSDASLPAPQPRPPGPVALLGPRRGNLWLVNCYGQPMVMSLQHPGERLLGTDAALGAFDRPACFKTGCPALRRGNGCV